MLALSFVYFSINKFFACLVSRGQRSFEHLPIRPSPDRDPVPLLGHSLSRASLRGRDHALLHTHGGGCGRRNLTLSAGPSTPRGRPLPARGYSEAAVSSDPTGVPRERWGWGGIWVLVGGRGWCGRQGVR